MEWLNSFCYGSFGGVIIQVIALYKIRRIRPLPDWFFSPLYWITGFAMILIGGAVVLLYNGNQSVELTPLLCANIGASAPLMFGEISDQIDSISPGKVDIEQQNSPATE